MVSLSSQTALVTAWGAGFRIDVNGSYRSDGRERGAHSAVDCARAALALVADAMRAD